MCQTLSYTMSSLSDKGLHIREIIVCTHEEHFVDLLIKRKGREKARLNLQIYRGTGTHQNQVYFYLEGIIETTPSLGFPCFHLIKGGMHLVYESEDAEDSTESYVDEFFKALLDHWQLAVSLRTEF
ncbi:hypothetical protein AMTRI_Chr05g67510 [Amborella trichopoda]